MIHKTNGFNFIRGAESGKAFKRVISEERARNGDSTSFRGLVELALAVLPDRVLDVY